MTTKIYRIYLLAFCLFASFCVSPSPAVPVEGAAPATHIGAAPPLVGAPNWQSFTSQEGRFSVLFPSPPAAKTLVLSPVEETLQQFISRGGGSIYIFQYADRPTKEVQLLSAEKLLSFSDDAFLNANHGSLLSKRHLVLNGNPGHEIAAHLNNGRNELQRTYLIGSRRFTLITVQPYGQPKTGSKDVSRFFESFSLIKPASANMKR